MNFNDLIDKLTQRKLNLITAQDLVQWLSDNVKVTPYISLSKKYSIASMIKNSYKQLISNEDMDDFSLEYINLQYDVISAFYILFAYIDMVVPIDKMTIENYDLIMSSGFSNYIMCYAGDDYKDFVAKCEKLTGIRDLEILHEFMTQIAERFDISNIQEIRKELNKLDMRKLGLIESVARFNDPLTAEVADTLKVAAREKAKEEMKDNTENVKE
nr:MAG TPA: hypothetical protein [Caudoviricetes sp.]